MPVRSVLLTLPLLGALTPGASAQPGRVGPAPVYLPPPTFSQGLSPQVTPRPLGYHVVPYGGLGYGPLGDRTGYPGGIYSNFNGSYRNTPSLPPLTLETPRGLPLRSGPLPTITDLYPGTPAADLEVRRMPPPTPPGPVVPVGEVKNGEK